MGVAEGDDEVVVVGVMDEVGDFDVVDDLEYEVVDVMRTLVVLVLVLHVGLMFRDVHDDDLVYVRVEVFPPIFVCVVQEHVKKGICIVDVMTAGAGAGLGSANVRCENSSNGATNKCRQCMAE